MARRGFTLIEMLTVIVIIVILAGLVIAGSGFVKDKRSQSQAQIQIKLLGNAIQEYQLDTGSFPPSTDPQGKNQTNELFRVLYWDGAQPDSNRKIYLPELDPLNNSQGWVEGTGENAIIIDPWGSEYRYRTGEAARNPDFDLWSIGKDGATNPDSPTDTVNNDDIRE